MVKKFSKHTPEQIVRKLDNRHTDTSVYKKPLKFSTIISIFPVNKALCNITDNIHKKKQIVAIHGHATIPY